MKVVFVEVGKRAVVKELEEGLSFLQKAVGGLIQAIYPFEDEVALICNEEGILQGLTANRALKDDDGNVLDIIFGDFLITGLSEDNFASLSLELAEKYQQMFANPQVIFSIDKQLIVVENQTMEGEKNESGIHRTGKTGSRN